MTKMTTIQVPRVTNKSNFCDLWKTIQFTRNPSTDMRLIKPQFLVFMLAIHLNGTFLKKPTILIKLTIYNDSIPEDQERDRGLE